jgi:hypothetical protein
MFSGTEQEELVPTPLKPRFSVFAVCDAVFTPKAIDGIDVESFTSSYDVDRNGPHRRCMYFVAQWLETNQPLAPSL